MDDAALKRDLTQYLQVARDTLVWKLEGLGEYDARRPLVPTGTNLLGLVRHVATVEAGYLGEVFGRPFPEPMPWADEGAEPNDDLWVGPAESRADVLGLYRRVWAHSDATVATLPLDAPGSVGWWPLERRHVTLHQILVHMIAETHRHAGHADIVRELVDGTVGHRRAVGNLPDADPAWWQAYRDRVEAAAAEAGGGAAPGGDSSSG